MVPVCSETQISSMGLKTVCIYMISLLLLRIIGSSIIVKHNNAGQRGHG